MRASVPAYLVLAALALSVGGAQTAGAELLLQDDGDQPDVGVVFLPYVPSHAHLKSTAMHNAEDAMDATLAEVPLRCNPRDPVARLVTAVDVGKWLGTCLNWTSRKPHWLVGVRADSMLEPDRTPPTGFEGLYSVWYANGGEQCAFGTLDGRRLKYSQIVEMPNRDLIITYETPPPPATGRPPNEPIPRRTPPDVRATVEARRTQEAECRREHW
jgi:hypothetical protein